METYHSNMARRRVLSLQREGRIIRQGNENPTVEIFTYVTKETFDAYLYQLVENKQKFIGQIMTSKSPVRSAEDVDEQALSYAEIKALATGNPHIKEKMDLDVQVSKLKLLKQNHLSQRYALEDKVIKFYPAEIKKYENMIEGYKADIQTAQSQSILSEDGFSAMTIQGETFTDKKAAGTALLEECKAMTSPDPKRIGDYRGFYMELSFDTFEKQYKVTLVGMMRYPITLGTDIHGNITRLDNAISSMLDKPKAAEALLENTKTQFANAKEQIEKPFPQEEELRTKSARLDELNILLNMDHKENEIADGEISDEVPEKKAKSIAR